MSCQTEEQASSGGGREKLALNIDGARSPGYPKIIVHQPRCFA